MMRLRAMLRDPNSSSMVVGALLVIAGLIIIAATWAAVAARLEVPLQMPYLVSGSFGGLAAVGIGLAVINAQVSRRLHAQRQRDLDDLLDAALHAVDSRTSAVNARVKKAPRAAIKSGARKTSG